MYQLMHCQPHPPIEQTTMQAEQDYTLLRDCLKAGEFEKADDETRALLIRLAGPDAITRNWVYFTEVIHSHSRWLAEGGGTLLQAQGRTQRTTGNFGCHEAQCLGQSNDQVGLQSVYESRDLCEVSNAFETPTPKWLGAARFPQEANSIGRMWRLGGPLFGRESPAAT